jgi:hypothetical protein
MDASCQTEPEVTQPVTAVPSHFDSASLCQISPISPPNKSNKSNKSNKPRREREEGPGKGVMFSSRKEFESVVQELVSLRLRVFELEHQDQHQHQQQRGTRQPRRRPL